MLGISAIFVLQARKASMTPPLYRDNVGHRLIKIDEATIEKFGDVNDSTM
jgi:hypothetical protein